MSGLDLDLLLLTGELRMRTATGPLKLDELHFVLLQVFLTRTLRGERDVLILQQLVQHLQYLVALHHQPPHLAPLLTGGLRTASVAGLPHTSGRCRRLT